MTGGADMNKTDEVVVAFAKSTEQNGSAVTRGQDELTLDEIAQKLGLTHEGPLERWSGPSTSRQSNLSIPTKPNAQRVLAPARCKEHQPNSVAKNTRRTQARARVA